MVEMIVAIGTCLVLWFGAHMVLDGSLSAGSLIVFVLYLGKMYKPMQELSKMTDTYSKAAVAYERIREVLETEARCGGPARRRGRLRRFKGHIEFDHVTFSYDREIADAARRELPDRAGTGGGARRSDRGRQDHHHQPDSALLRSHLPER